MHHVPQDLTTDRDRPGGMSRRQFLRASLGGVSVACLFPNCGGGSNKEDRVPLLWVETGVCTGCACSLLGSLAPPSETILPELRMPFQETLMQGYGSEAVDELLATAAEQAGRFILVVDGAIPVGAAAGMTMLGQGGDGIELSAAQLVAGLAAQAGRVLALGTCASFGGIPGSAPGTGSYVSLGELLGSVPMRIPGCPPNPAWIASALLALLRGEAVPLDPLGRPTAFFGQTVHAQCPRLEAYKKGDFAAMPGDATRCLFKVGCKGAIALADCPSRLWQGRSYCIKANHPCIGCTSPGFLDSRPVVDGQDVGVEGQAAAPFAKPLGILP